MKNLRTILITLCTVIAILFAQDSIGPEPTSIPEKIVDTVTLTENGSGIIIHSTETHALVLTAYHVVMDKITPDGELIDKEDPVQVNFMFFFKLDDKVKFLRIAYKADKVYVNETEDIALLEIETNTRVNYAKISLKEPKVGEEVFLAGNPNFNYRTLTKGIISNKDRYVNHTHVWQLSGGVIYGSSGGGAFNMDGDLIAIAKSVDLYHSGFCFGNEEETACLRNAIPHIGYFVPLSVIKNFLLSTEFKDRFEYLK